MSDSRKKIVTLRSVYTVTLVQCLLLLSACSRYVDVRPSADERAMMDSVLTFLDAADESALTGAFSALDDESFKRTVTTNQLDDAGQITESSVDIQAASAFVPYQISEDRGYNNARHETKYTFQFLPDTVMGDHIVRVAEIMVRSLAAAEVPVQNVRFFVDPETQQVIAIRLRRLSKSLLYREESLIYLEGRRIATGVIVPNRFDVQTNVKAFFSVPIRLSTSSVFEPIAVR